MAKLSTETAGKLCKQAISTAIAERNIELLVDLIRKPPPQEIRDHLADVIEGNPKRTFARRRVPPYLRPLELLV